MARNTESQSGKGFKNQTLRAIDLFLNAVEMHGKDATIFVATENIGDIRLHVDEKEHIGENKNTKAQLSLNTHEVLNTLVNFIDIYLKPDTKNKISFGFYTTSNKRENDSLGLEKSVLEYLATNNLNDTVISIVKSKIIEKYKGVYNKGNKGNLETIEKFNDSDWISFLTKINWEFNLDENKELKSRLKERIKEKFLPKDDEFNGIEDSIVSEFESQLEELQLNKKCFEYKDFDNIILKEINRRYRKIDFGDFKKLTPDKLPNEIKITKDKFFFTKNEKEIIYKIKNQFLYSKGNNFILLTGNRAQGKTILSIQVGLELIENNFLVLFLDLKSAESIIINKLKDIQVKHSKTLCILTNCHLKLDLFEKIIKNHNEYEDVKFLFESRLINCEFIDGKVDLDFLQEIPTFELQHNERDYRVKYNGILNSYFPQITFNNLVTDELIKETGRSYVYLFEFLKNFDDSNTNDFSMINKSNIKEKVKLEFIKKITKYQQLVKYAIINQYEIPVNCSHDDQEDWFREIMTNENVLMRTYTSYYQFYHSDFASLLVKAFFDSERITDELEYEKKSFINYLNLFEFSEIRIDSIIKTLYQNADRKLLSLLLSDKSLKERLFSYYKNFENFNSNVNPTKPLLEILTYVDELLPSSMPNYLNEVVSNNDAVKDMIQMDNSFILTLIKISSFFKKYALEDYESFTKNLSVHLSHISSDISFSTICGYLSISYKSDKYLYTLLRSKYTDEVLLEAAIKEEFLTLMEGIRILYLLNDVSCDFIELIPLDIIIEKAERTNFKRFAKGLQVFDHINKHSLAENLFSNYSEYKFKSNLQNLDLNEAILVSNIFKKYGYVKVHKNVNLVDLGVSIQLYSFPTLINLLIEIHKYFENYKQANAFVDKINFDNILELIYKESPSLVANNLSLFTNCKGYRNKSKEILKLIHNSFFLDELVTLKFFKICETLHWINIVENSECEKSKEIFEQLSVIAFKNQIEKENFSNIILGISFLDKISKQKAGEVLETNKEIINLKLNETSFESISKTLLSLSNIKSEFAAEICQSLLTDIKFQDFLLSKPINVVSRSLKELDLLLKTTNSKVDKCLVKSFYHSIDNSKFINASTNIRFDLISSSLNELQSIESDSSIKTQELFQLYDFEQLISTCSLKEISFGLINLKAISSESTQILFDKSFDTIINIASRSTLEDLSDCLKLIEKVSLGRAKSIFLHPKIDVLILSEHVNNYDLDKIKRLIYYLKPYDLKKTSLLLQNINTDNLVFKFEKVEYFDKATEYLSHLFEVNQDKIRDVVRAIGVEKIYQRSKDLDIKLIIQGLSKIYKIEEIIAKHTLRRIITTRDIKIEFENVSDFSDITQKILIFKKISANDNLVNEVLEHIGFSGFITKIINSSESQLRLGFSNLYSINMIFARNVARKLCETNSKYENIIVRNGQKEILLKRNK